MPKATQQKPEENPDSTFNVPSTLHVVGFDSRYQGRGGKVRNGSIVRDMFSKFIISKLPW